MPFIKDNTYLFFVICTLSLSVKAFKYCISLLLWWRVQHKGSSNSVWLNDFQKRRSCQMCFLKTHDPWIYKSKIIWTLIILYWPFLWRRSYLLFGRPQTHWIWDDILRWPTSLRFQISKILSILRCTAYVPPPFLCKLLTLTELLCSCYLYNIIRF